ncbi:hypothetical protein BDV96DRAFT_500170 [Lophiotrema nucula]|uniref:NAD-dependent epimerase/dehydratase domain-containing protein n=1 Tax=Lophiotrema nucula TaxID=690887 RepID=A0A6A5YW17_9PLEO|nr:hypothetical protein BDV96DRAFT_500170 [Lophiotrema nucula]
MYTSRILLHDPALPDGSLVLVTGANGYTAAHVCNQLLLAGYRVRGTVRSLERTQWLADILNHRYGPGRFELSNVEMLSEEGAFDEAMKAVDGVIHIASETSLSTDAEKILATATAGALNALRSAAKETSVKRFVFTSSSTAVSMPQANGTPKQPVDQSIYNESAIRYAHGLSDPSKSVPNRNPGVAEGYVVYAASKAVAEKAVWKFVEEEKPGFVVNSVVPNATFGAPIDPLRTTPSVSVAVNLFKATLEEDLAVKMARFMPPKWSIDVQDCGRLHVAALLSKSLEKERLFGFVEQTNWNLALGTWRKEFPQREFVEDFNYEGTGMDESDALVVRERADQVLKGIGYGGFRVSLAQSLKETVQAFL